MTSLLYMVTHDFIVPGIKDITKDQVDDSKGFFFPRELFFKLYGHQNIVEQTTRPPPTHIQTSRHLVNIVTKMSWAIYRGYSGIYIFTNSFIKQQTSSVNTL